MMAFPCAYAKACFGEDQEDILIYERNTFLTFETAQRSQRKRASTSVPADFKVTSRELIFDSIARKLPVIPKVSSVAAMSATTSAFSDTDAVSDSESTAWCSEACPAGDGDLEATRDAATSRAQAAGRAPMGLCELIAPRGAPELPCLSAHAKEFVPNATAPTAQEWKRTQLRAQVESTILAVQSAMLSTGLLVRVYATPTVGSWSVCALVQPGNQLYTHSLLAVAKRALVTSVEQSATIYMLGYLAKPFADEANGFSVTLCGMEDEATACWDYYSQGFCYRGCACKWEHPRLGGPQLQTAVKVEVRC